MQLARVKSFEFLVGYNIRVMFADGFSGELNLEPLLKGRLFGPLRDMTVFKSARIDCGTLVWANDADICPDVLRFWCELGRVTSQEEIDAHFTKVLQVPAQSSA